MQVVNKLIHVNFLKHALLISLSSNVRIPQEHLGKA
jgi:hypothetical protein